MKTKIFIVVDLSSVDKIDTRQFLYNQTFVGGSFSMCCMSFNSLKVINFDVWQLKVSKYIITKIWARKLQTQSSRKQTHFMPSRYPLSAPFCLLIFADLVLWINDDTMTPTENVYTAGLWYTTRPSVWNCRNLCI